MNGKKLLFFLLMPIYVPLALFMNSVYPWWESLPEKKNTLLFIILLPFFAPLGMLLNAPILGFAWWMKLAE